MTDYLELFEIWMNEQFIEDYHGPKGGVLEGGSVEAYERWRDNMSEDVLVLHAIKYGMLRAKNLLSEKESAK